MENSFRFEVVENHHEEIVEQSKRDRQLRDEVRVAGHTYAMSDVGSAWYHEAAVIDARGSHAHPYR